MHALALIALLAAVQVPRPAPELAITVPPEGKQLLLSQFRGKVVAVEFLSTTCQHCQKCSAILNQMLQKYGPQGFQPLGVAFNANAALLVPDYVKQLNLKFPVGVAAPEQVVAYIQHPPRERLLVPQLMFIDRKGVIRAHYPAEDKFFQDEEVNMRAQIEALLKEKPPARKRK